MLDLIEIYTLLHKSCAVFVDKTPTREVGPGTNLKNEDILKNEDNLLNKDTLVLMTVPGPSLHNISCACFLVDSLSLSDGGQTS